jgi:hypothetical protein
MVPSFYHRLKKGEFMIKKTNISVFILSLLSYATIFTQNHIEQSPIILFVNKVSHAAWSSFFFVTRILGALFMGNGTYCIQALALFAFVIAIEAYTLHYMTKVSYSRALYRMTIINSIHTIISLFIILLNIFEMLITYKYLGIFVMLGIRILICYGIYSRMDKQVNRIVLRKAIIIANSLGFILSTIVLMVMES